MTKLQKETLENLVSLLDNDDRRITQMQHNRRCEYDAVNDLIKLLHRTHPESYDIIARLDTAIVECEDAHREEVLRYAVEELVK